MPIDHFNKSFMANSVIPCYIVHVCYINSQALKECFETQSVSKLQSVLDSMSKEDATYHMQRCVDSG